MQPRESVRRYRGIGLVILLVLVAPLTIINYLGYRATERFVILLLAANVVMPFIGLYMTATGKNPFLRKK